MKTKDLTPCSHVGHAAGICQATTNPASALYGLPYAQAATLYGHVASAYSEGRADQAAEHGGGKKAPPQPRRTAQIA